MYYYYYYKLIKCHYSHSKTWAILQLKNPNMRNDCCFNKIFRTIKTQLIKYFFDGKDTTLVNYFYKKKLRKKEQYC